MFHAMGKCYEGLMDKSGIHAELVGFQGFDTHRSEEAEFYRVAFDYSCERVFESHERVLHRYRSMAKRWIIAAEFLPSDLDDSLVPLDLTDLPGMHLVYENAADIDLESASVASMGFDPPCGELVSCGQKCGAAREPLPAQLTMTWRVRGESDRTADVAVPEAARRASRGELRLTFGKTKTWSATFRESTYQEED